MSKISINVNKIEKQIKELRNISSNMDGIIDRMAAVISSDVMSEQTFLPLKKNIEKEMEQLKKERRNNMLLAANLGKITNQYKTTDSNIAKGKIKNQKVTIYTASKKSGSKNKLSVLDKLENLWKKFERFSSRLASLGIDYALLKYYLKKQLIKAAFKKGSFEDKLQAALMSFIQDNIHDSSVLGAMSLLAMINTVPRKVINAHFNHNKKVWNSNKKDYLDVNGKYIEHQEKMDKIKYGENNNALSDVFIGGRKLTGKENTCEAIAAYNALVSLEGEKLETTFPELLSEFEKNGIMLDGYFGTSPDSIAGYFENEGYDTKMLVGNDIESKSLKTLTDNYDTYIVTVYNSDADITQEIHTMSITAEEVGINKAGDPIYKYMIHNDFIDNNEGKKYNSLEEALNSYGKKNSDFETISVIGIKNKEDK